MTQTQVNMPLTPLNKVHRDFPSLFAEKMSEHAKQRTQFYQQGSLESGQTSQEKTQGSSEPVSKSGIPASHHYKQYRESGRDDVNMEPLGGE